MKHYRTAWAVLALAAVSLAGAPCAQAGARPIRFYRLTMEEGLSHSTVLAMLQDKQGFMWFGTEDGLNRYDGAEVTLYSRNASDPASLPNNTVSSPAAAAKSEVGVGTGAGR